VIQRPRLGVNIVNEAIVVGEINFIRNERTNKGIRPVVGFKGSPALYVWDDVVAGRMVPLPTRKFGTLSTLH
jgi:hypothetical protein